MLKHACKAEKSAARPWLEKAYAILGKRIAADPVAEAYDEMLERERAFWLRAAGAADLVARHGGHLKSAELAALENPVWDAVRAVIVKSAQRAQQIAGVV